MATENTIDQKLRLTGRFLLLIAFFISGAASLIFEVIWTRILLISIGATAAAVGVVLGAFMAGMAAGSYLAGRRFLSRFDPAIIYALLEGWIGVYGLFTPPLLRSTGAAPTVVQFGGALLVILPAAIAMGASLPILSRLFTGESKYRAVELGRFYAANTAGAVVGPLISVFWLFPAFGLNRTLHIAAGADLVLFAGLLLGRKILPAWERPEPQKEKPAAALPGRGDIPLLIALGVSGAAAMVYEVAWARILAIVYGSSVYGVTIMLSTFLLGIAGGSALIGRILRSRKETVPLTWPAWLLAGSGFGAFVSLLIARQLPFLFVKLYNSTAGSAPALFLSQFVISFLLMLPTTLCLGAMIPAAASFSSSISKIEFGRQVSRLYTANLVGSAVGAATAAGLLIAHFGLELTVRSAAILALLAALLAAARKTAANFPAGRVAALAGILLLVIVIDPPGEPVRGGFGFYNDPRAFQQYDAAGLREIVAVHQTLYYRDGPTASVCVQQVDRSLFLKINGKTDSSNGVGDVNTQLLLGHLPLLAAEAKRVAVIGLGCGMTAGAVLTHPVEWVDVFEIEPAVVEASRFFDDLTGRPLDDPRLHLVLGDARSRLQRETKSYDLIISEPSNPWITGISNLFTRDFFTLAAAKLKKEGILTQWFHLYGMSEEAACSLIATFRSVFPHTLIFKDRDLILLGSRRPIRFDMRRMQQAFAAPRIRRNLELTLIRYPFDLLVQLRLDEQGAAAFSKGGILNTDDNMLLELTAPLSLYHDRVAALRDKIARYSHEVIDYMSGYTSKAEVYLELAASLFTAGHRDEAQQVCVRALAIEDSFNGRKLLGLILHTMGRSEEARQTLLKALSLGGDEQGRSFVQALLNSIDSSTRKK